MPAFVEMHPRVPMRRGVTAADMPAGQAQTQVHPARADSQAILAAFRTRCYSAEFWICGAVAAFAAGLKGVVPHVVDYVSSKRAAVREHSVSYLIGLPKR
jgi:hypothetical protein